MYKIYINETPLFLTGADDPIIQELSGRERVLISPYAGKAKFLLNYIDMLEKGKRFDAVVVFAENLSRLKDDFFQHYIQVEAAGGLVSSPAGKVLMIFRLEHWDLPKGKIDPGESPETAAVREVKEETGLQQPELKASLGTTYHTYRNSSGKRMLKITYWFHMLAEETELVPQAEEDISAAVWEDPKQLLKDTPFPVYGNIKGLLEAFSK